jgi:hypothetical protein
VTNCCVINPLNAELNPICHLLALLGAHHILHVSRIRVKCEIWASHSGIDEDSSFLGYYDMLTGKQLSRSSISRSVLLGSLNLKIVTIYQSTRRNIRKNFNIRVNICSPISRSILKPMVHKRQHRRSLSWELCQMRSPHPTCLIFVSLFQKSLF